MRLTIKLISFESFPALELEGLSIEALAVGLNGRLELELLKLKVLDRF